MKNFCYLFFYIAYGCTSHVIAQCGKAISLGKSSGILTKIANSSKQVATDKDLNTVVFIYRHDEQALGGNSGNLRYDVSVNGGVNWVIGQGVLNPLSTSLARYPNALIANPTGNSSPTSAYLGYLAPTVSGPFFEWDGTVSGVRRLDGTGNTEAYHVHGTSTMVPLTNLVHGAPNTCWAVGHNYDVSVTASTNKISVLKGTFTGSHISWSTNSVITVPATISGQFVRLQTINLAFDPTGKFGWISMHANLAGMPALAYYPVFYHTDNGGNSWNGPVLVDPTAFSCISNSIQSVSAHVQVSDLAVDALGNPHLLVPMVSGSGSAPDYTKPHHLYDITREHGLWTAHPVGGLRSQPKSYPSGAVQYWSPQISRTRDGEKLFFSWTETPGIAMGAENSAPDLYVRGFDVKNRKWTNAKDFSGCDPNVSGSIFLNHMAAEVLEPAPNVFKLAAVFSKFNIPVEFFFLDSCFFNTSEFTNVQKDPVISATPGLDAALCLPAATTLQITSPFDKILWFNGAQTQSVQVNTGGQYSVAARAGCDVGMRVFTVSPLYIEAPYSSTIACEGESIVLSVNSNGNLNWSPGGATGSMAAVTPSVDMVYTIQANSGSGCVASAQISVNVDQCTGITHQKNGLFSIYPNPAGDLLWVKFTGDATLLVTDAIGRIVFSGSLKHTENPVIDVSGWKPGLYFMTGSLNNLPVSVKFTKE